MINTRCKICGYEGNLIEAYDIETKQQIIICEACLLEHPFYEYKDNHSEELNF